MPLPGTLRTLLTNLASNTEAAEVELVCLIAFRSWSARSFKRSCTNGKHSLARPAHTEGWEADIVHYFSRSQILFSLASKSAPTHAQS